MPSNIVTLFGARVAAVVDMCSTSAAQIDVSFAPCLVSAAAMCSFHGLGNDASIRNRIGGKI